MTLALFACQLSLALIFLLSATGKILNADQFLTALQSSSLPQVLILPLAIGIPAVEMALFIGLVASNGPALIQLLAVAIALLCAFTVWMSAMDRRGLRIRCGCFGTGKTEIGLPTILRNLGFLVLALAGLFLALRTQGTLLAPSLWLVMTTTSLGMSVMLLQAFLQAKPALVLSWAELLQDQPHEEPDVVA
jgi:hypothetical protein